MEAGILSGTHRVEQKMMREQLEWWMGGRMGWC